MIFFVLLAVFAVGVAGGVFYMARSSAHWLHARVGVLTVAAQIAMQDFEEQLEVRFATAVADGTRKLQAQHDRHEGRLVRLSQRVNEHLERDHGEIVRG